MASVPIQAAPQDRLARLGERALVTARAVTRRYGVENDVCVKALRGVSLDVEGSGTQQVAYADVAKAKVQVELNRKEG